jgi:hypothetical protein
MSFNYKQYTANNPLLQEVDEEVTVSSSGVEMEEGSNYPRVALEQAALEAKEAGVDREEAVTIVNQAYGAGMSSDSLNEEVDIWQMAGDHLENFRDELSSAYAIASQNGLKDWMMALNKIVIHLDALEGAIAEANAKLGVLPTN